MKKYILLLLPLLPSGLFSQTLVRGQVLDALTREPLLAATISLQGGAGGTFSDSLGQFQLHLPAPRRLAD